MAIVKMKKLRVIAMADHREALMKGLLKLGCVEISEPDGKLADPAWAALLERGTSALAETRTEMADVRTALAAVQRYGQLKNGLFIQRRSVSEQEFLGAEHAEKAREASKRVGELLRRISGLQSEEARLLAKQAALRPWISLDVPLEQCGTQHTGFRLGVCPGATDTGAVRGALAAADAAAELYEIHADKQQKYYFLIFHRAEEETVQELLRPFGFSAVAFPDTAGTAAENMAQSEQLLAENRSAQEAAAAGIVQRAEDRELLRMYVDRLNAEMSKEAGAERLLTDGTIVFFEGWVPEENLPQTQALLEQLGCAWEALDPAEEEIPHVPTDLLHP